MRLLEIHLEVNDLEKSLTLYTQLIPHKAVKRWEDGSAVAFVLDDGSAFGLWQTGKRGVHNGRGGQHVHFAFQIKLEDYHHYVDLIREVGLQPLEYVWPDQQKSVYFFDADGHQGEFMTKDWLC